VIEVQATLVMVWRPCRAPAGQLGDRL